MPRSLLALNEVMLMFNLALVLEGRWASLIPAGISLCGIAIALWSYRWTLRAESARLTT